MKKLSKITESVFGDIIRRSNGNITRKEDEGKLIQLNGRKYVLPKSFITDDNNNEEIYNFIAFNLPEHGNVIKDCIVGYDHFDVEYPEQYNTYVLKDYIDLKENEFINNILKNGNISDAPNKEINDLITTYTKKIFTDGLLSQLAEQNIFYYWNSFSIKPFCICINSQLNLNNVAGNISQEEFDCYEKYNRTLVVMIPYIDNWHDEFKKNLISICKKTGWEILESYDIDDFSDDFPSNTDYICFVNKNEKITESVFADIIRRSSSDAIRKEDELNDCIDLGDDTDVYWNQYNLEIDGKSKFYFNEIKNYNKKGWRLPTMHEAEKLKDKFSKINWINGYTNIHFKKELQVEPLKLKRDISSTGFTMWTKSKNTIFPHNAFGYGFDNAYRFQCDSYNTDFNKLYVFLVKDKKYCKTNESVFADIIRRSSGDAIRKEDENTNIKKLKTIDLGGSVLWADDDIHIYDDYLFSFDEANEILKNTGWRLPTLKEVAELKYIKPHYFKNGSFHIGDLSLKPGGLIRTISEKTIIDQKYYYCWTADEYKQNSVHIFTMDDDNIYFSPLNDKSIVKQVVQHRDDKLCIRPVKDR